jgi:HK97 family phage major capsid protein
MKYSNTLEYSEAIANLIKRNLDIVSLCKKEEREMNEDEEKEFDENKEELKELENEKEELEKSLEQPEDENKEQKSNKNMEKMEKKNFSIVDEIRKSMESHQPIVLNRSAITVAAEGEDVVATDVWNVWEPLRQENVLAAAGAKIYTGLQGDVQIPVFSKGSVAWKGETAAADDGNGSFSSVSLSPKRITGKFPVSLQFLAQTTPDVEAAIRNDIAMAFSEKIEATLLGNAQGSTTQPAGLFYGLTAETVNSYADLLDVEAEAEEDNYKNCKYVLSPKAKAALKGMIKGQNATGMVMEGNEVDGVEAFVSSNVAAKKGLYGAFDNLVIGIWDELRIDVVADSTTLANGQVMIILNGFADAKLVRSDALVAIDTTVAAASGSGVGQ